MQEENISHTYQLVTWNKRLKQINAFLLFTKMQLELYKNELSPEQKEKDLLNGPNMNFIQQLIAEGQNGIIISYVIMQLRPTDHIDIFADAISNVYGFVDEHDITTYKEFSPRRKTAFVRKLSREYIKWYKKNCLYPVFDGILNTLETCCAMAIRLHLEDKPTKDLLLDYMCEPLIKEK